VELDAIDLQLIRDLYRWGDGSFPRGEGHARASIRQPASLWTKAATPFVDIMPRLG
jgi:hypothetical protein